MHRTSLAHVRRPAARVAARVIAATLVLAAAAALAAGGSRLRDDPAPPAATAAGNATAARSPRIRSIRVLQSVGARGRFAPTNDSLVFDRKNADGYFDVYLSDLDGRITASITEGKPGIGQRHNGNAIFHPSGAFIVFISEVQEHYGARALAEPGIGLFNNLWATDARGRTFWQLTDVPIKKSLRDRTPAIATVNPVFSPDGTFLVWTERYANGGNHNWGRWRIKGAEFVVVDGAPRLQRERILFTPRQGNYVTAMGFFDRSHLLVAGNLEGQHEYSMDEYCLDIGSGRFVNLTATANAWEEGAAVAPNGQVVFMSSRDSSEPLDHDNPRWWRQGISKEWYLMNGDGSNVERLSFFNDKTAPEHSGRNTWAVNMNVSPDGRHLAGTVGVASKRGNRGGPQSLSLLLVEFATPLRHRAAVRP